KEQAAQFARDVAERLSRFTAASGHRGLIVFAVDTELLGHWWSEGPIWLEQALRLLPEQGVRLVTLDRVAAEVAAGAREPRKARLHASSWGEAKDLRTWDGPSVHDLCWASRRLELRLLHSLDR